MEYIYSFLDMVLPFEWLQYNFMKNAFLGSIIISILFGLIGTMVVNNKMAFFSDALGHSALTGIALGVIFGIVNPVYSMLIFAVFFALGIYYVNSKRISSTDTVIGVFSSTAVALGIVILSKGGGFNKYSDFLIGDILSITANEIIVLFGILIVTLILWFNIFNKLVLISVNHSLARSRKVNVKLYEIIFIMILAVIVTFCIRWIGLLIINALLILPAATARNVAKNMKQYVGISVLVSLISGITGLIASYYLDTASGSTIILVSAAIYFLSFLGSRRR